MKLEAITYRKKTADEKDIFTHLTTCNNSFQPALSERVNIKDYSEKIFKHAVTFEAWSGHELAGLIAAYFNQEKHSAFITSVSVIKSHMGSGIASQLLEMCIHDAKTHNYRDIGLEVNKNNIPAVNFYRKFHFAQTGAKEDSLIMSILLK